MSVDRPRTNRAVVVGVVGVLAASCGGTPAVSTLESADAVYASAARGLDYECYRDNVEPMFVRPRGGFVPGAAPCVSCHTYQTTTPLKLEPLNVENGRVFWTEEQSRRNFQVVSRLVVPNDPDSSRLLRKPLAAEAGGAEEHTGGTFWESKDDPEWRVLAEWVTSAGPGAAPPATPPQPDFAFFRQCVQPIFTNPRPNAVACTECHSGGGRMGFGRAPRDGRSWTEDESRASYDALMSFIEPGFPQLSRFLHHPLNPRVGGDFMHNGGRRWSSREDPEWQALAAWIRGEARGEQCPPALQFTTN